jgi:flagellar basal body rod protein FlgG
MESLSLLANNLANAATSGFKADKEFYGVYASAEAESEFGGAATIPVIQRQWTDYSPGTITPTGNPLDVALSGRGFLTANSPSGPLYTRNGSMHIVASGELANSDGFPLRATSGGTIRVTSSEALEVLPDGTVRQQGRELGRLAVVDFKSTDPLEKVSGSTFKNLDPANLPTPAASVQVLQGKLEGSNVSVPESAMRLVGVMRQFEMLQKAVSMGVEMNSKAIQEVARVGS